MSEPTHEQMPERRQAGMVERHVQTAMMAVATAGVIALASMAWDTAKTMAGFSVQIQQLTNEVQTVSISMQSLAGSAETKADHQSDMARAEALHRDHEERIRDLEDGKRISPSTRSGR